MQITKLRAHEDINHEYYVHDNQIAAAKQVVDVFVHGSHWCLLLSQMQSGKTGTFSSVPFLIKNNPDVLNALNISTTKGILNTYIITGMNFRDLFDQISDDFEGYNGEKFKEHQKLKNYGLSQITNIATKKNLTAKETELLSKIRNNSLIIIDESHYGAGNTNILNEFFKNVLDITLDGSSENILQERNCYILSVSATPMAETTSMHDPRFYTKVNKKKVKLRMDKGYFGIVDFFKAGKIQNSFPLKDNTGIDKMLELANSYKNPGYTIVRYNGDVKSIIDYNYRNRHKFNLDILMFDQEAKRINKIDSINEYLTEQPKRNTIILIKDMLRAGIVLSNKENVRMVFDTHVSKVDTAAQSLLGRCCGYNANKETDIYCDLESAITYKNWVESDYSETFPMGNAAHMPKVSIKKNENSAEYHTVPAHISRFISADRLDRGLIEILNNHDLRRKPKNIKQEIINQYIRMDKDYKSLNFHKSIMNDASKDTVSYRQKNPANIGFLGGFAKKITKSDVGKNFLNLVIEYDNHKKVKGIRYQNGIIEPKTVNINDPVKGSSAYKYKNDDEI